MFKVYLEKIQEPRRFVCYSGKFSPFHKAHKAVYDYLCGLPGISKTDVYIFTKFEDNDFLTSGQKLKIINLSGVPVDNVINMTGSGYNIQSLLKAVNGNENDVLITAFSQKDLDDGTKKYFLSPPKDNITSWRQVSNVNDIPHLRPVNFVHQEYKDRGVEAEKQKKGNGYFIVAPTQKQEGIISSSAIREAISKNDWAKVEKLMVNEKSVNYLKEIKK